MAELDLTPLMPPEALTPLAEEITGRQRRRERRAEQEARTAQREAAAAADAIAAAAARGLTARELKVGFCDDSAFSGFRVLIVEAYLACQRCQCKVHESPRYNVEDCVPAAGVSLPICALASNRNRDPLRWWLEPVNATMEIC